MNDQIKEILEKNNIILSHNKLPKGMTTCENYGLSGNCGIKCPLFKNGTCEVYKDVVERIITNLQEENKEWSMIFDTFSKRPYAHKYLEEKKKELGNDKIIGLDSEMIYKEYYDYKSRCEKAIEYIKENQDMSYYGAVVNTKMEIILNILGGKNE